MANERAEAKKVSDSLEEMFNLLCHMHKDTQAKVDLIALKIDKIERLLSWLTEPPLVRSTKKEVTQIYMPPLVNSKSKKWITLTFWAILICFMVLVTVFLQNPLLFINKTLF